MEGDECKAWITAKAFILLTEHWINSEAEFKGRDMTVKRALLVGCITALHRVEKPLYEDKNAVLQARATMLRGIRQLPPTNAILTSVGNFLKKTLGQSALAQIFDPLGFVSPITVRAKMLLQELWAQNYSWDQIPPQDIIKKLTLIKEDLSKIGAITIPRWIIIHNRSTCEIHGFSNASQLAMAAVIYIKTISTNAASSISLICAKSKVAPLKKMTIPRLELSAALMLAKLSSHVQTTLNINISAIHLWTDSSVSLTWIRSKPSRWNDFVLSIYRVGRTTNDAYREKLLENLKRILKEKTNGRTDVPALDVIYTSYNSFVNDLNFIKVVAMYDMYFHRFMKHDLAYLRVGTLSSRYKDCSGLMTHNSLSKAAGFDHPRRILTWAYTNDFGKDIQRLYDGNEELTNIYSYFPYQSDFGLVRKSAYSSVAVPTIYYICCVVGTLLGHERYRKGIFMLSSDTVNATTNGMVMGYALTTVKSMDRQFVAPEEYQRLGQRVGAAEDDALDGEGDLDGIDAEQEPFSTDGGDWFNYMVARNWENNEDMKAFFAKQKVLLKDSRAGTVGEHLYQQL